MVGLLWDKTPYGEKRDMPKIGVVKRLPSLGSTLYEVVSIHPIESTRVYQFYANEMIELPLTALNGDSL